MEQNKVNSFLLANKDNLPSDKIVYIKEKLNKADESSYDAVMTVKMKNSVVALILSILLGYIGIDRFYAGDILKGVLKLITGGACGIWYFIDCFLIMNTIKNKNYNELMLNL